MILWAIIKGDFQNADVSCQLQHKVISHGGVREPGLPPTHPFPRPSLLPPALEHAGVFLIYVTTETNGPQPLMPVSLDLHPTVTIPRSTTKKVQERFLDEFHYFQARLVGSPSVSLKSHLEAPAREAEGWSRPLCQGGVLRSGRQPKVGCNSGAEEPLEEWKAGGAILGLPQGKEANRLDIFTGNQVYFWSKG